MQELFMDVSDELLSDMLLMIEGAITLFETDVASLNRLAIKNDMMIAAKGFNTIGSALYDLRQCIRKFEAAYVQEVKRNLEQ